MRAARALGAAALALATFLAFLPALHAGFVNWDDHKNLVENTGFRGLGGAQLRWMFTTTLMGHYIPLTWLSFGVNFALGGLDPWGYHLGNMALHVGNALLFHQVARRLLARATGGSGVGVEAGALLAAALFALHPLRAESVAWVTERRDVLSGACYLLSVLAFLRGVDGGGPLRGRWRVLSAAAMGAGLLAKGSVVTLPASLLVLDVYPLRRRALGWGTLLREKLPHLALALAGCGIALWAQLPGVNPYAQFGLGARIALVGYSLWFYPAAFVWPAGLSPLYEAPRVVALADPRFVGPWLAVLAVTAGLVALARRWPAGLAAWTHAAIAVGPTSGIVHAGYQLAHDRYSYLAGFGFALLGGGALAWLARRAHAGRIAPWVARAGLVAAVLVALALGAGAWRQTAIWHDSQTLWRAALTADPACALCAQNLALALMQAEARPPGWLVEAEQLLRTAIGLRPDRPEPYYNLASVLVWQKRFAEAERMLQAYRAAFPGLADGPLRLGMLARDRGAPGDALAPLREALRMDPRRPDTRTELGLALRERAAQLEAGGRAVEGQALRREADGLRPPAPRP